MSRLPYLARGLFNTPIAIHPRKAEVVMAALGERMGIANLYRFDGTLAPPPIALADDDEFVRPRGTRNDQGYDVIDGVALIPIEGTLVQKLGSLRPYSGMTGYDGIRQSFHAALQDREGKAIALLIDSPGGEVAGCFDLADEICEARKSKTLVAVLNESAYSAAYCLASAASKIIVPRTGGTGSVGVICMHVDLSGALKAGGMNVTLISYGDHKTDGAPEFPLTREALNAEQRDINKMGGMFDRTVARNRGMSAAAVKALQAATFMGSDGIAAGLADAIMSPAEALAGLVDYFGVDAAPGPSARRRS